ncbi:MAG: hypothetical protein AAFQ22_07165 [Pseudomonadota bacterium]
MVAVPFLMEHAERREHKLPKAECVNLYAEPTGTATWAPVTLHAMPGLKVWSDLTATTLDVEGVSGTPAFRGVYYKAGVFDGRIVALYGERVLLIDPNTGAATRIAGLINNDEAFTVINTGNGFQAGTNTTLTNATLVSGELARFAGDNDEVMMVAAGRLYRITVDESETATIRRANWVSRYQGGERLPDIVDLDYLNGWFIYVFADGRFGWSRVNDGDTINALDFASPDSQPDKLRSVMVVGDEVFLFGDETIESYVNVADPDAPFQRRPGGTILQGILSCQAKCQADNSFFWVGHDGIVYRMGGAATAISTPGIEEAIARLATANCQANVRLWPMIWRGHIFVVLDLPNVGSYAFDIRTQRWIKLETRGQALYRGRDYMRVGRRDVIVDRYKPRLLEMDPATHTDPDGGEIRYAATAHLRQAPRNTRINSAVVIGSKGLGTKPLEAPVAKISASLDGGQSYGEPKLAGLGGVGQTGFRTKVTKFARVEDEGCVIKVEITDPVEGLRLDAIKVNEK